MDKVFRIVELLHKSRTGRLDDRERAELEEWLRVDGNREWAERIGTGAYETEALRQFHRYDAGSAYRRWSRRPADDSIQSSGDSRRTLSASGGRRIRLRGWGWVRVAAVVLPLALAAGWLLRREGTGGEGIVPVVRHGIAAGGSRAVLTLPGGRQVELGKTQPVYTREATGVTVKADSSRLVYERKEQPAAQLVYNELYVPRKGEYSLQLSDGTRVYLNADSRLRYPEIFGQGERQVELCGEAYFEVRQDPGRPFVVNVGEMRVHVTGTVFNVNAYAGMPAVTTTLVAGKVSVEYPGKRLELAPGEQASLHKSDRTLGKTKVNTALYTAWKDGLFKFERENLENIMQVLERWYDVQVFFHNEELKQSLFSGDLKKYDHIEEHLKMLEMTTNIRFVVNGNTVFVGYKTK